MRYAASVLGLLLLPAFAFGETAYEALRKVSSEKDASYLNKVVGLKGEEGTPQPKTWVILLDDPASRGGVREIEVTNGKITSERTPIMTPAETGGTPINFQKLNLDSKGAFAVAEQAARSAKVGFDSLDYSLRKGAGDAPIWFVELRDRTRKSVGNLTIAADTGKVVSSNFKAAETVVEQIEEEGEGVGDKIKDTAKDVGRKINKGFHKVGGKLESFFTGKRTIDRKD